MKPEAAAAAGAEPGTRAGAAEFAPLQLADAVPLVRPPLPAPEGGDGAEAEGRAFLEELRAAAARHRFGGAALLTRDLRHLPSAALALVDAAFGEGEVTALIESPRVRIAETVFPGFWRVRRYDARGALESDRVEVGPVPAVVAEAALLGSRPRLPPRPAAPGVARGQALLTELVTASARGAGAATHVVNLTLLPVTAADVRWLAAALGAGPVSLLSRGYGTCRITSTGLRHTWWVQYFNGMDALILNTLEVTAVPEAALAAAEDFRQSLSHLGAWLETLR